MAEAPEGVDGRCLGLVALDALEAGHDPAPSCYFRFSVLPLLVSHERMFAPSPGQPPISPPNGQGLLLGVQALGLSPGKVVGTG